MQCIGFGNIWLQIMNKLSFIKEQDVARPGPNNLYRVVFNDVKAHYIFDDVALKVSSEKDGIYPLMVCECDTIVCDGVYITTRMEDEDIIWEKFWFGQCAGQPEADDKLDSFALVFNDLKEKDLVIKPPLRFKLSEYRALADEIANDRKSGPKDVERGEQWYDETLEKYRVGDTARI